MTNDTLHKLRYSKADGEKYRSLIQDELSPFYGATFKDLFIYAATYGFRYGMRQKLIRPQSNIPLSVFSKEELWLLKAIAITESKSLHILNNEKAMYQISEEYANGVLETINLEVFGGKPGEPYRRMMQDVLDEFARMQK